MPHIFSSRRFWIITAVSVVILAAIAIAATVYVQNELDPGDPVLGATAVEVSDNQFSPAATQIETGQTVTWTWTGQEDHNVIADEFESPTQSSGTFAYTFTEPGTYEYECTLHFFMRGEVVVQ